MNLFHLVISTVEERMDWGLKTFATNKQKWCLYIIKETWIWYVQESV